MGELFNFFLNVGQAYIILYFLISSITKLLSFQYFKQQLQKMNVIKNNKIIFVVSVCIIFLEFILAILLAFNVYRTLVLLALCTIVLFFTFIVLKLLMEKSADLSCACFGRFFETKIGVEKIVANCLLIVVMIILMFNTDKQLSEITSYLIALTCMFIYLVIKSGSNQLKRTQNFSNNIQKHLNTWKRSDKPF